MIWLAVLSVLIGLTNMALTLLLVLPRLDKLRPNVEA